MVSAVTISFAFVFEPAESNIMSKNPRHKNENIIKKQDTVRILYVAMLIASLGLGVNQHLLSVGVNHNIASTVTLNIIVFCYFKKFLYKQNSFFSCGNTYSFTNVHNLYSTNA